MFGYGQNSRNGRNPNFLNPDRCVICNLPFYTFESLISHYEAHIRDRENEAMFYAMMEGQYLPLANNPQPYNYPFNAPNLLNNNAVQIQNQQVAQRNVWPALLPQQPLQVPAPAQAAAAIPPQPPPQAAPIRNNYGVVQPQPQQWGLQRPVQHDRGQNLIRPNVNMGGRAAVAQPNQPPATRVPEVIDLDFEDDNNSSDDGSINLDLTLG